MSAPPALDAGRKTVIWIASYPKSGNTWVRFLACNLLYGPQDSAAALNALAPDVHELAGAPAPPTRPVLMKTHFPLSPHLPLRECTAAAIYVLRHPADVLISNFHYSRRSGVLAGHDARAFEDYLDAYLAAGGDPRWTRLGMGTWCENVDSWTRRDTDVPALCLRYEDLLADAAACARRLCAFLGIERSAQAISDAVQGASFERLRQIEHSDIRSGRIGIFYKPYLQPSISAGLRFMRSGAAGEARRVMSAAQTRRIDAAFGTVMQAWGYVPAVSERIA
jgi:aryl sulfotransferase